MDAVSLLADQVRQIHKWTEDTIADLTPEQVAWKPAGKANGIAPLLIHIAAAEDMFLPMMTGRQGLAMGAYAGKTGASEPHPMGGYEEWAKRVTVDLPQTQEYVRAVFRNTEEYVSGLKPEDLDREIDLSVAGMGKMSLGAFITMTSLMHPTTHAGEISCVKGLQGSKGYSF